MSSDLYHRADFEVQLESVLFAFGVVALAFGFGAGLAIGASVVAGLFGITRESAPTLATVVVTIPQFVGFMLAVVAYVAVREDRDLIRWRVPTVGDAGWAAIGFVVLIVAAWAASAVAAFFGAESAQNRVITMGQSNPELFIYMIPITILFVAPAEELVFRGAVQGLFRRAWGVVPAVVLTSLAFGVVHVVALSGSGKLLYIGVVAVLGLVLGAVYEHTENLVVPIAIHGAWNAMLFAAQYAMAVYDVPMPQ